MWKQNPEGAEQEFFKALIEADKATLDRLLEDDFLLIDVMTGSEVSKAALLDVVDDGELRFDEVNRLDYLVRVYGEVAVITGQTEMAGTFNGRRFELESRYTHVLVAKGNTWRMVSAQGTQIIALPANSQVRLTGMESFLCQ